MYNNINLKQLSAVCLIATGMFTASVSAIVIRHDKPAELYLASKADFPPLATFYNIGVHGTLIAPDWVLTAAHTVFCLNPGQSIAVGDELVEVKARYSYPSYQLGEQNDLALIQLAKPVLSVAPAKLYRQQDEREQVLWFIGSGGTGTGLTGETVGYKENNGVLRKAQNKVVAVTKSDLRFVFESGQHGLELEGVSGNGDSGGPAYLKQDDGYYLLGVSSRVDSWFKDVGEYGVKELYTRVSSHANWIDQVMAADNGERAKLSSSDGFLQDGMTAENLPGICASISLKTPV
ncbi:trypsin-like serine protease [Rheinheimera sp.]|uniref:S1 family peptidase n=1 Tax=Rheinheimera sp. TaxID=1869214 RepID=UPI0027355F8F|nr:trypsin-like serine protease [Rheinheimera sp.]MDP2717080.1 trypsin-like serine protease [Rheinheimera sp.]